MESWKQCKKSGFSLVEIMVAIGILATVLVISLPVYVVLNKQYNLNNSAEAVFDNLISAREKTLASELDSQYGIYFDPILNNKYVLFKGDSYLTRDILADKIYYLSKGFEFYNVNLPGDQIVFEKITGVVLSAGDLAVRHKSDPNLTSTAIYINGLGQISKKPFPAGSDGSRVKDSRHVHFDYLRTIDLAESIILDFGIASYSLPVAGNLQGINFDWEGTLDVSGSGQLLKIRTINGLINPEFCIFRDARYNNQPLTITVSGDVSGSLAEYSSDGLTVNHASIYVENFICK